jgi:hypothetical protein
LLLGVAALWRADFALLAAFAAFIVWLLHAPISEGGGALVRRLPGAAAMTLGALSVAAPLLGLFLILGGVRAFKALFVWPLTSTYHATLPWPDLFIKLDPAMLAGATHFQRLARRLAGWPAYFPLLVLSVGICRLLWRRGDRCLSPVVSWLVVLGLGLGVYAGGRSDYPHILPMLFVSLVLAAALLLDWASAKWRPRWAGGLVLLAIAALIPWPTQSLLDTRSQAGRVPVPFPRARGLLADATLVSDYSRLIRELDQRSPPGSFLYSGAPRHDAFYPNDVLVYFLAERDPATYYWCLDAAVTSAAPVQRDMIRDLEAAGVREVVLWSSFPVTDARPRAGSRSLDDWLVGAFGPAEQIGRFSLLHKRAAEQARMADPPS